MWHWGILYMDIELGRVNKSMGDEGRRCCFLDGGYENHWNADGQFMLIVPILSVTPNPSDSSARVGLSLTYLDSSWIQEDSHLVGGFKLVLRFSISYMGGHPSHRLSLHIFFKMVIAPPTSYIIH
jgi:hypothetical protein